MPTPPRAKPPASPLPTVASTPATPGADKGRRRMQMTDIARMAGVSASTVSRALSGSPLIPEATRTRITELARSLNYRVNAGAASLRKGDVQTIGVVLLSDSAQMISDPFLLGILGSLTDAVNEQGMNLLLSRLHEDSKDRMRSMVESGQVTGLIVIGQLTLHDYLNELTRDGFPMVVWGANLADAQYSVVGGDNEQGGYLAASHLLSRGCRRIAFLGDIEHPEAGQRYAGYLRAHREAGIEPDVRLRQSVLFNEPMLLQVVQEWLSQGLSFDAVFASSDVAAIAVISALNARGIDVPRDVKVVGYDDIEMAGHVFPSLTSIRQPTQQAGQSLVTLLNEAQLGQSPRTVVLASELIERQSSR